MPLSQTAKQNSVQPGSKKANPFDSDSDSESKPARTSSAPVVSKTNPKVSPFGYDDTKSSSSSYSVPAGAKKRYKNDFRDSGGLENQSVQELEDYAAYKSEETTQKVNECLKIAEIIKEDATNTLVTLHKQGEQISRTHQAAADIEHDLSRSEKLLGSLGGIFSKPWKPKKTRQIKGPALITKEDSFKRRANHLEQREKLGLPSSPRGKNPRKYSEPTSALDKVQVEKAKQDDTLGDLSDILGQLKGMALDMGSELDSQNKALDGLQDDVDELNFRVKGAKERGRHLVGK